MTQLFTSGYEGETINGFIEKILNNGVETIIDIRENPFSRKPGFSKKIFQKVLTDRGIEYLHFKELGTPKPLRKFLADVGDYQTFFEEYKNFLMEFQDSIDDIVEIGSQKNICLLCFEKDPHYCHRKVIAELLKDYTGREITVIHI